MRILVLFLLIVQLVLAGCSPGGSFHARVAKSKSVVPTDPMITPEAPKVIGQHTLGFLKITDAELTQQNGGDLLFKAKATLHRGNNQPPWTTNIELDGRIFYHSESDTLRADMYPVNGDKSGEFPIRARALCKDAEVCKEVIIDVFLNDGTRTFAEQVIVEMESHPDDSNKTQEPAQESEERTPPQTTPGKTFQQPKRPITPTPKQPTRGQQSPKRTAQKPVQLPKRPVTKTPSQNAPATSVPPKDSARTETPAAPPSSPQPLEPVPRATPDRLEAPASPDALPQTPADSSSDEDERGFLRRAWDWVRGKDSEDTSKIRGESPSPLSTPALGDTSSAIQKPGLDAPPRPSRETPSIYRNEETEKPRTLGQRIKNFFGYGKTEGLPEYSKTSEQTLLAQQSAAQKISRSAKAREGGNRAQSQRSAPGVASSGSGKPQALTEAPKPLNAPALSGSSGAALPPSTQNNASSSSRKAPTLTAPSADSAPKSGTSTPPPALSQPQSPTTQLQTQLVQEQEEPAHDDEEHDLEPDARPSVYVGTLHESTEELFKRDRPSITESKRPTQRPSNLRSRRPVNQVIGYPNNGSLQNSSDFLKLNTGKEYVLVDTFQNRHFGSYDLFQALRYMAVYFKSDARFGIMTVNDTSKQSGGLICCNDEGKPVHASHQNGLDADISYPFAPGMNAFTGHVGDRGRGKLLSTFPARATWAVFKAVWKMDEDGLKIMDRIFVNPAIKPALCREADRLGERGKYTELLRRIRETPGHHSHFHLRIKCSRHQPLCQYQGDPETGSGCSSPKGG